MKNDKLVSIIVPIFGVEQYLQKCVDSILMQTYTKLEVILVDDGSPDGCGVMCDEYAKKDERIKVIHKKNGGLSDARNVGIEVSNGDYLIFIDGDDYVSKIYVEALLLTAEKNGCDMATISNFTNFYGEESDKLNNDILDISKNISIYNNIETLKMCLYWKISVWIGGIYKRKLFKNTLFPKDLYYEDLATMYKIILNANKIGVIYGELYAYRQNVNGITLSKFENKHLGCIEVTRDLVTNIRQQAPELYDAAIARAFALNYNVFIKVPLFDKKDSSILFKELKKYRMGVILNNDDMLRKKDRIGAAVSFFGPFISAIAGKIYARYIK